MDNQNNNVNSWGTNAGGLAGNINGGKYTNLFLEDITINNQAGDHVYSGGFAGSIGDGEFRKIVLHNIKSIQTTGNSHIATGGFVGYLANYGNLIMQNIILNNIESILATGNEKSREVRAGGFVGEFSSFGDINRFENIVLNNIQSIEAKGYKKDVSAGGFVGFVTKYSTLNLENVYLYFNDNAILKSSYRAGKVVGDYEKLTANFENIYLTYKRGGEVDKAVSDKPLFRKYTIMDSKEELFALINKNMEEAGVYQEGDNFFLRDNSQANFLPMGDRVGNSYLIGDIKLDEKDFDMKILHDALGSLSFDILNGDKDSIMQTIWFMLGFIKEDNEALGEFKLANQNQLEFFKNEESLKGIFQALDRIQALKESGKIDVAMLNKYNAIYAEYKKNLKLYDATIQDTYMKNLEKELSQQYAKLSSQFAEIARQRELIKQEIGNAFGVDSDYAIFKNASIRFNLGLVTGFDTFIEKDGDDNLKFAGVPKSELLDRNNKEPVFINPYQEEKDVYDEEKNRYTEKACFVSENPKTNNPCIVQMVTSY